MSLPTELRLKIFEHLFDNRTPITLFRGSDTIVLVNSAQTEPPDPTNKSRHYGVIEVLKVSRQIHDEAEEAFYNHTLFGIIASPYQVPAKVSPGIEGLRSMPSGHIPLRILRRVRKLLFVMHLRGSAYIRYGYRVGDLRYLQAMENLRDIRIVFTSPKSLSHSMAPIQAIVENVPPSARIRFGPYTPRPLTNNAFERLELYPGSPIRTAAINGDDAWKSLYVLVGEYASKIHERRGILSGSEFDHSFCCYKDCVEGKGCVNSELETPPPKKQKALSKLLDALAMTG